MRLISFRPSKTHSVTSTPASSKISLLLTKVSAATHFVLPKVKPAASAAAMTELTCAMWSAFFCSSGVSSCSLSSSVASSSETPAAAAAGFFAVAVAAEAEGAGAAVGAATWTLDIFCAIAVPTLGCRVGFGGFAATALPAAPCGFAKAGWFFLSKIGRMRVQ